MVDIRNRREPEVPERGTARRKPETQERPEFLGPEPEPQAIGPVATIAVAVIAIACVFLVGERLYAWYVANKALNELTELSESAMKDAQRAMEELSARQQARQREIQRQNEARIAKLRQERAQSVPGQWLSKNCSDWTRSWSQLQAETARREMEKHCGRYSRYLDTGIAPPDAPRASRR